MHCNITSIANALEILQFCTKPSIYHESTGLFLPTVSQPTRPSFFRGRNVRQLTTLPKDTPISINCNLLILGCHDDVIKWKHFPRYWPFVWGIHWSPVNSPHKGQWCGALMFSLICAWINEWVNDREAGDLRRHSAHYDVIVMIIYRKAYSENIPYLQYRKRWL